MNDEQKNSFNKNMFQQQQMSSSQSQFSTHSSSSTNDQDELIERRKLEQKRRFQQKQGNIHTNVDTLMQSMFSDLKLQPKTDTQTHLESTKPVSLISELSNPSVNHHVQPTQAHASVPGAADWSKIAFDSELTTIFNPEEKTNHIPAINSKQSSTLHHSIEQSSPSASIYPSWCSQPLAFLPLVYQQVFEASCLSDVIQTSVLYPILLLSGLRQDQLSQIWSQVNLTQPGILIKEELFMALALIALTQNSNGQIFSNNHLYNLTDIPIPHFQIQQESPPPPPPPPVVSAPPPPPPSESVYYQEDFADFTSFDHIVQNTHTNDDNGGGGGGLLLDFDDNHLSTPDIKTTSSETQSIASLDLPNPTINPINQDSLSRDNISYTSSNNNENIPVTDTQSLHSITSFEPSKLELTQFSFFSDDTSEIDCHLSVWLRCFEKCYSILSQANEIFSSIQSPNLCLEVLQQTRTREYVYHLQEIFHVHKRIYTAATIQQPPITTIQLTTLWKQIIVLWTNLQSFFSTAHLHLLNDDDIDYSSLLLNDTSSYCSICLLSTIGLDTVLPSSLLSSFNIACLTFAGRLYHAPCANFYLNLIDGILPSLRRSS